LAQLSGLLSAAGTDRTFGQETARRAIAWKQDDASRLFVQCEVEGRPLVPPFAAGLLEAFCALGNDESGQRLALGGQTATGQLGPIRAELTHRLLESAPGSGEDLLEARLRLTNTAAQPQTVCAGCVSFAQPAADPAQQRAYLPLAASGLMQHAALKSLGYQQEKDPDQAIGRRDFVAHYLEPAASDAAIRHSPAMLLTPVADLYQAGQPWRVALFAPSGMGQRFASRPSPDGPCGWSLRRRQTLAPRQQTEQRGFLLAHRGEADVAWRAFHRHAHLEDFAPLGWLDEMRVHYYDFLSAADPAGRRGDGFEADLPLFRQFHVGLATQHGWYAWWGDYLHPDRKTWQAMRADKRGPAEMSFEKMKARIAATRQAGAKAAVYLHLSGLDETSPAFTKLRDAVLVDDAGQPVRYPWQGPDTPGPNRFMSIAAAPWREHLLQQAQWIMEVLRPDAIVMDETFTGLGYDEHPDRRGCLSTHAIAFFRQLRKLLRSFDRQCALLTSDCSLAAFVPWADGEAGDHAYPPLLGHPLYRKTPVRYLAALGGKPWRACAWDFTRFWDAQMDLARKVGAGVGVSNGWIQYTGLAQLPAEQARRMQTDIASLFARRRAR
jgi:hypothetical protein